MKKDIYIIKNKINNKVYIGQAANTEQRYKGHKSNAKSLIRHSAIDEAMNGLGVENFYYEIIERVENYNEREMFWIKYYNCLIPNGYNILEGGNSKPQHNSIKSEEELLKIIDDICNSNKSLKQIGDENNLSLKIISAINRGTSYRRDYDYPLRKRIDDTLNNDLLFQIKKEIINSNNSLREISKKYNVNTTIVRKVNEGKLLYDNKIKYPIRNTNEKPEYLDIVINLLFNTSKSLRSIAKENNISYSTVQGINSGRYYYNPLLTYPIRGSAKSI